MRVWQDKQGRWHYDINARCPDGKWERERRLCKATSHSGAVAIAHARAQHIEKHGIGPAEAPPFRLFYGRFWRQHVEAENLRPSQRESIESIYRTHLEEPLGDLLVSEIDTQVLQNLKSNLQGTSPATRKPRSVKTVNNVLILVRTILLRAQDWGVIKEAPKVKKLKRQKPKIKFYSVDEFLRYLEAAQRLSPLHEAFLLAGSHAGLRAGEICALVPQDANLKTMVLSIQRSIWKGKETGTKGYATREIPISPMLADAFARCIVSKTQPRILMLKGKPVTHRDLRTLMRQISREAGGPITEKMHVLRHTFGTHLLAMGANVRNAQGLLGHADVQTTEGYTHVIDANLVRDIRRLETALGKPKALGKKKASA